MKTMKGLDFWTRSGVWWELIIPGYFFGKTFGTSDAKYRVIDTFMYPEVFIRLSGFQNWSGPMYILNVKT